jgi:hypothetical protein
MKKIRVNIKKRGGKTCSNILTPKQVGPICWFMATFVAMFYSQRSRKLLIEASKHWDDNYLLFKLFKFILDNKYKKNSSENKKNYEYFYTEFVYFIILLFLNKFNNKVFPYDPLNSNAILGFSPQLYIGKLYNLLKIDNNIYEYNITNNILAYSYLNKEFDNIITPHHTFQNSQFYIDYKINYALYNNLNLNYIKHNPPSILIIIITNKFILNYTTYLNKNIINEGDEKNNLISMNENITYMNVKYNLDSVLLNNWNKSSLGVHVIAGITCKKKHYVYNGWTRSSMDPAMGTAIIGEFPCELMKYDWNIKNNSDFCLNTIKCIPDELKHKIENDGLCFNFSKGDRILIYVRDDINTPQSSSSQDESSRNLSSQEDKSQDSSSQLFKKHTHLRSSKKRQFSLTPMPSLHKHEPFSLHKHEPFSLHEDKLVSLHKYKPFSLHKDKPFSLHKDKPFSLHKYKPFSLH